MGDWLRVSGEGPALNMAQVLDVSVMENGAVKVHQAGNTTLFLHGDEARRVLAWLEAHADLPVLAPEAER